MGSRAALLLTPLIGVLSACGSDPPLPTPAELLAQGKALVVIEDPVRWNLAAPPPLGMRIEITTLDGASACHAGRCPTEAAAPAGKVSLGYRCLVVRGELRLPRGEGRVEGELQAGHTYGIRPLTVLPDCQVKLEDVTGAP